MRAVAMVAIALVAISSTAIAADPAATTNPEDKIICKRIQETSTGSHFPMSKRTCMKKSEWKQLADETDRTLRKVGDQRVNPNSDIATMGGGPS